MPAITYNYPAASCPAVLQPATYIDTGAATPNVWELIGTGYQPGLSGYLSRNARRDEAMARNGAGGWGICWGLDITYTSGLSITVTAGQAMIDGPTPGSPVAVTKAVTDNIARAYLWQNQSGTIPNPINNSQTPPAGATAYLGSVKTVSGAVTEIDYSGRVLMLRGGLLWRRTGDTGAPLDTPPAGLALLTRTQSGLYLWDSVAHQQLGPGMQAANSVPLNGTAGGAATLAAARPTRVRLVITNEDPGLGIRVGPHTSTIDATHGMLVAPGQTETIYYTGAVDIAAVSGSPAYSGFEEYN